MWEGILCRLSGQLSAKNYRQFLAEPVESLTSTAEIRYVSHQLANIEKTSFQLIY